MIITEANYSKFFDLRLIFLIVTMTLSHTYAQSKKIYTLGDLKGLKNTDSVEHLNISSSRIQSLEFLVNFINLKTLDASNNRLGLFIFDYYLPKLESLVLSDNDIQALVIIKDSLPNLKELCLSKNSLKKLDSNFFKGFSKLEKVDLSRNFLEKLPKSLYLLNSLKELDISSNYYIEISQFFQSQILKNITAQFCYFKQVPKPILKIKYLSKLDISHNQIETIKLEKDNFAFLQSLDVSFNQLSSIKFISKLDNIKYFQARRNKIRNLPKRLNLTLTLFDVSHNQISFFNPKYIGNIEYFIISNNLLSIKDLTVFLDINNKYMDFGGNIIKTIKFINKRTKSTSTHIIIPKHTSFEIDKPDNKISIEQ